MAADLLAWINEKQLDREIGEFLVTGRAHDFKLPGDIAPAHAEMLVRIVLRKLDDAGLLNRRAPPLAAPAPSATTTGEDERPIAAGSAGNLRARIGDGGLCRDCGSWSPVGHAEAHDHFADCPSIATPPAAPAAVTDSAEFRMVYEESKAMAGELAKRIRLMEWMETRLRLFDTFASSRTCKNVDAAMASRFGESDAQLRALAAAASAERGA